MAQAHGEGFQGRGKTCAGHEDDRKHRHTGRTASEASSGKYKCERWGFRSKQEPECLPPVHSWPERDVLSICRKRLSSSLWQFLMDLEACNSYHFALSSLDFESVLQPFDLFPAAIRQIFQKPQCPLSTGHTSKFDMQSPHPLHPIYLSLHQLSSPSPPRLSQVFTLLQLLSFPTPAQLSLCKLIHPSRPTCDCHFEGSMRKCLPTTQAFHVRHLPLSNFLQVYFSSPERNC